MRLAFPNGEHDEVSVGKGTLTIGTGAGDDIVLDAEGIEPGHAIIIVDRRGITLNVDGKPGAVSVNGRSVVEKAILRLGDRLEIGPVSMVLRTEQDQLRAPPRKRDGARGARAGSSRYHLRGISGFHQGRIIPLGGELSVGPGESCDVVVPDAGPEPELARFEPGADGVYLRSSGAQALDVNGHQVTELVLSPGDQMTFGAHRFLLETPGFVPGKAYAGTPAENQASNTQVFASPVIDEAAAAPSPAARDAGFTAHASSRDAIVVTVCVLLSAAMLIWLFFLS